MLTIVWTDPQGATHSESVTSPLAFLYRVEELQATPGITIVTD